MALPECVRTEEVGGGENGKLRKSLSPPPHSNSSNNPTIQRFTSNEPRTLTTGTGLSGFHLSEEIRIPFILFKCQMTSPVEKPW